MSRSHVTAGAPPLINDPGASRPASAPRLILLDLDGTCIERGNDPPERTPAAIARACALGITVTIATGRAYLSALPWARKLGALGPLICGQGAAIRELPRPGSSEPGRLLFHAPISPPTATDAVLFAREQGWPFIVDAGLELVTEAALWPRAEVPPRNDPITVITDATEVTAGGVDRVVVVLRDRPADEADEADRRIRRAFGERAEITRSTPAFIEVTDLGATKGQALLRLAEHLGIDPAATVAIGDGYNDLDMLAAAGFAVGIAGSVEAVLARADCVCRPPAEAGVADVLEAVGVGMKPMTGRQSRPASGHDPETEYTLGGMTGQLADFLSPHLERVAEIWARTAGVKPEVRDVPVSRGPRQFLNAVLVALSADDLEPLIAFYELEADKAGGLEERLERALQQLGVLRPATAQAALEYGLDLEARLNLALTAADEIGVVSARMSALIAKRLAAQIASTTSSREAGGASLSFTMHELRRPLTILNSYGQLLSAGMLGQMPETAMVAIEGITASTEMMVRMVNALAELSRLEDPDDQLTLESMSLSELVGGGVETVTMEARLRDCTIDQEVAAPVSLRGDRRRLTLALTNILGNAVKHAPNGSTIWVRAWENGGMIHISVRDEGPGFAPEETPHLFEKYYRSVAERHRKVPGSGLGLYIVRTVAERHNGAVTGRSEPGSGAEFEMILPRSDKPR